MEITPQEMESTRIARWGKVEPYGETFIESRMPGFGELEQAVPPIGRRGHTRQTAFRLEPPQDAAEVAAVQRQIAAELGGRGLVAVRQFVQDTHLGQREVAGEVGGQHADALRVKAIEAADGLDVGGRDGHD